MKKSGYLGIAETQEARPNMHVKQVLSRWLEQRSVIGHAMRAEALIKVVQALVLGGKAALTQLGRFRAGSAHVKHYIKAVDRLLGNEHLHGESPDLQGNCADIAGGRQAAVLTIDWADFECSGGRQSAMIKAAVPIGGRAVVDYSRVFPFKRYSSPGAHREFLRGLKLVLPDGSKPILITDAGFRGPWFRAVEALGWDWVGRIRNRIKYLNEDTGRWIFTNALYKLATPVTQYIGNLLLSPRFGYRFRLYLVHAYAPAGGGRRKANNRRPNAKICRKLHKAPWLLATSLPNERGSARRIKQLYAKRMQIEETLRDAKSHRFGFGLRYARSGSLERIQVLLLVVALATLVLWLVGLAARARDVARHFQANTVSKRAVLSTPFLGRQLLLRRLADFPSAVFDESLARLRTLISHALPS